MVVNCLDMSFQATFLRKLLTAASFIALERFFAKVNSLNVAVQIRFLTEWTTAARLVTHKVLFATMDEFHMLDKITVLLESGSAFFTIVRFFARARGFMFLVSAGTGKSVLAI